MIGTQYIVKIGQEELLINAEAILTIKDLREQICRVKGFKPERLSLFYHGENLKDRPDSTPLEELGLKQDRFFLARVASEEQEEGTVGTVLSKNDELQEHRMDKQEELMKNEKDKYQQFSKLLRMAPEQQREYIEQRARKITKPEPRWPKELPSEPLLQRRQKAVQQLAAKLKEQGVKDAQQLARMGHGREQHTRIYLRYNGQIMQQQVCDYMENSWMKRIVRHYMTCMPMRRRKEALITTYGLIDFVLGRATEYYPALQYMMQDRKKMFYEFAGPAWFFAEPVVPNPQQDNAYTDSLPGFTDQSIVKQVQRITKDKNDAVRCVEASQNDLECAIGIALHGNIFARENGLLQIEQKQQRDLSVIQEWEEQPYLFIWLMNQKNDLLRLRLQCNPSFLQIFTLSMKHLCPGLYKLLVKHRQYIRRIMQKRPPKLYQEKPQF